MTRSIKILVVIAMVLGMSWNMAAQQLVILHTNDTHSQIEPFRTGRNANRAGVDRRLQFIDSIKTEYGKDRVLVVDAGDYDQGSPYYVLGKGAIERDLMNVLGYEAVAMGNHELDSSQEQLLALLKGANYPLLCCNYDFSESILKDVVKPYTIIKKKGLKIGIVGATSYLESNVLYENLKGLKRLDTVVEVNKWAQYLREEKGCDLIIFLSHLGFDKGTYEKPSDDIIAAESENIDIIIGGHSHTFIKEPKFVANKNGKDVIIVTAGEKGVQMGMLKVF